MVRGKSWTEAEINSLLDMVHQGMSVDQIAKSGKFANRTSKAIEDAVSRLSFETRKKKSFGAQIREAEIVGLETVVKRYLDAFNKICDLEEYDKLDLERFRIIFMAAWKYRELFREYQEMEKVEARIEQLERTMAEIQAKQKGPQVSATS
jgi:hypothetical protein